MAADSDKTHGPRPALVGGAEAERLAEDAGRERNWKRWGPYLAERQWGTVREDYSPSGDAWGYFTHEQARSRADYGKLIPWPGDVVTVARVLEQKGALTSWVAEAIPTA